MSMLFFFELFLFVLVMLTLALGEFVSRGLALTLWLVVSAFTWIGYLFARRSVASVLAGGSAIPFGQPPTPPVEPSALAESPGADAESTAPRPIPGHGPAGAPASIDEKWARTLLYNWRRTNVLLFIGALVVGGWYWLGLGS
jgi:hypothetical protein